MGFQIAGQLVIAFAEWTVLQQLTKVIAVALRGEEWVEGFGVEDAVIFSIKFQLIDHSPRNNEVVPVFKRNISEHRTQGTRTAVDEKHFIGIRILVEVIPHGMARSGHPNVYIGIDQQTHQRW